VVPLSPGRVISGERVNLPRCTTRSRRPSTRCRAASDQNLINTHLHGRPPPAQPALPKDGTTIVARPESRAPSPARSTNGLSGAKTAAGRERCHSTKPTRQRLSADGRGRSANISHPRALIPDTTLTSISRRPTWVATGDTVSLGRALCQPSTTPNGGRSTAIISTVETYIKSAMNRRIRPRSWPAGEARRTCKRSMTWLVQVRDAVQTRSRRQERSGAIAAKPLGRDRRQACTPTRWRRQHGPIMVYRQTQGRQGNKA